MEKITLSRLISDGAIFQRNKDIHVWGFAKEGLTVNVSLSLQGDDAGNSDESLKGVCDDKGCFEVWFDKKEAGGPYVLTVYAEGCESEKISFGDIYVGDVFVISGQSNMEFPMCRVRDTYPEEWDNPNDSAIRTFKITEHGEFKGPVADVLTGEWVKFDKDSIDNYSAVGYFMAQRIREHEDIHVGLINLSLGGAPIEAFLSKEMLAGYDNALAEAEKYSHDNYRNEVLRLNDVNANRWHEHVDAEDKGLKESWQDGSNILAAGANFMMPEYFSDTELDGFVGSVWFARTFEVPKEYAGKEAILWFGTITDYDFCYVNGTLIGTTAYCYPPRRYPIPEGLLNEGTNTVVFRVGVEKGYGRFTPGKLLGVIFGDVRRITDGFTETTEGADMIINLAGCWKYMIGCGAGATKEIAPSEETVFVNWKSTALFNGMIYPVTKYPIKAFCFYQGESNCPRAAEYADLTRRQIEGYRKLWKDEKLPYVCVRLPKFNARIEEGSYDGGKAWRGLQEAQDKVTDIDGAYIVDAYEYGESNDLHPQRKKPVGRMIAEVIINEC